MRYIELVQNSAKMLNKTSVQIQKRCFVVEKSHALSDNMWRLVLRCQADLAQVLAGHALLLDVELPDVELPNMPCHDKTHKLRQTRYYTLRKTWQACDAMDQCQTYAWLDVYCHGEKHSKISLGKRWVKSRQVGNVITSQREFPEKIAHLGVEQALLIADETSLPTVARLLEQWQNPKLPMLAIFLQHKNDLLYLQDVKMANGLNWQALPQIIIHPNGNKANHQQIFLALQDFLQQQAVVIDCVWGGLEVNTTKKLRACLGELLALNRQQMVIKVYWRQD